MEDFISPPYSRAAEVAAVVTAAIFKGNSSSLSLSLSFNIGGWSLSYRLNESSVKISFPTTSDKYLFTISASSLTSPQFLISLKTIQKLYIDSLITSKVIFRNLKSFINEFLRGFHNLWLVTASLFILFTAARNLFLSIDIYIYINTLYKYINQISDKVLVNLVKPYTDTPNMRVFTMYPVKL